MNVRKLIAVALATGTLGGIVYASGVLPRAVAALASTFKPGTKNAPAPDAAGPAPPGPSDVRDGVLRLDPAQRDMIGLATATATAEDGPTDLELLGTTGYDDASLVRVRPRFDTLVQKVHVRVGQAVRKGEPLVELFSNELSEARNRYKVAYLEWVLARRLFDTRKDLAATGAISQVLWVQTQNAENKARLDRDLAANKLAVFGLAEDEIAPLVEGLSTEEHLSESLRKVKVSDLASMTLRAPADGVVIERNAAPQNLYDETSVLVTIAPLDHLLVWGNVYESDVAAVRPGLDCEVRFPYLGESATARVEYVSNRVDPATHAVKVRASIANPGGRFKADMLVRMFVKLPPEPGRTVIPRQALQAFGDEAFVFVRLPGEDGRYARRPVRVAQERADRVIVASGLEAGEEVVTAGSLLLAQIDEDRAVVSTGMPR